MPRPELRIVAEHEYAEAQRSIEVAPRDGIAFFQAALLTIVGGIAALAVIWLISVCVLSLGLPS